MDIGQRIKDRRLSLGLTLDELADAVGTIKQTIYKYEHGKVTNIPVDKIDALTVALKTSTAYLQGYVDDPDPNSPMIRLYQNLKDAAKNYRYANGFLSKTPILETLVQVVSEPEFYSMLQEFDYIINFDPENPNHYRTPYYFQGSLERLNISSEDYEGIQDLEYSKQLLTMHLSRLCNDLRTHRLFETQNEDLEAEDVHDGEG